MKVKEAKVLDYTFSDFAHVIHDIARPNTRVDDLTQELFENIVPEEIEDELEVESTTYGYYYNGRSINELCRKIGNHLDEERFIDWLDNLDLDDDHKNLFYTKLKGIGVKFDKRNKNKSIAKYFKEIIFQRSIIKTNDNVRFKLNIADDYINKSIEQDNKTLDKRIAPYYEYKRGNKNNETKSYLKPKSEELAKKMPIKVVGKFDIDNATEEELFNLNHLKELAPLVDYNNEPLVLPRIKESSKSINGVYVSNDKFEFNDVGLNMILLPRTNLQKVITTFSIRNSIMNVVLRNMELTMVHLPIKTIITNKNRNLDFPFDFELVFNFNEDQTEMTYSFNITLRREFVFDTKSILKFYMITRMLEDKTSIVKITIPELEQPLYCKEGYGNREFTKEEYLNISKFVKEVEKIIFLEDTLDTKFKFDVDWMKNNSSAIDIAYAALSHVDVFVCGKTSWTIETDIENLNDLTINSVIRFESDLSTIDLFGEIYELPAMKLLMNDAIVKKIDIDKNKKKLIVEALSISVAPLV